MDWKIVNREARRFYHFTSSIRYNLNGTLSKEKLYKWKYLVEITDTFR